MMKGNLIDGKIVSRFRGKLVKMMKDAGSKFESILSKIKQILLNRVYKLTEKHFFNVLTK